MSCLFMGNEREERENGEREISGNPILQIDNSFEREKKASLDVRVYKNFPYLRDGFLEVGAEYVSRKGSHH